jgi:hypothetical protein
MKRRANNVNICESLESERPSAANTSSGTAIRSSDTCCRLKTTHFLKKCPKTRMQIGVHFDFPFSVWFCLGLCVIYCLFNEAVSSSDCVASNEVMINE